MSKVTYQTKLGEYNAKVYVDIDVRVENGITKEDYEILRNALQTIEDIAFKYENKTAREAIDD